MPTQPCDDDVKEENGPKEESADGVQGIIDEQVDHSKWDAAMNRWRRESSGQLDATDSDSVMDQYQSELGDECCELVKGHHQQWRVMKAAAAVPATTKKTGKGRPRNRRCTTGSEALIAEMDQFLKKMADDKKFEISNRTKSTSSETSFSMFDNSPGQVQRRKSDSYGQNPPAYDAREVKLPRDEIYVQSYKHGMDDSVSSLEASLRHEDVDGRRARMRVYTVENVGSSSPNGVAGFDNGRDKLPARRRRKSFYCEDTPPYSRRSGCDVGGGGGDIRMPPFPILFV